MNGRTVNNIKRRPDQSRRQYIVAQFLRKPKRLPRTARRPAVLVVALKLQVVGEVVLRAPLARSCSLKLEEAVRLSLSLNPKARRRGVDRGENQQALALPVS